MARLAALYAWELGDGTIALIWIDSLRDLLAEQVDAAFRVVEQTFEPTSACRFPTPAHLRKHITEAASAAEREEAERAWHMVLRRVEEQYHPDLGWRGPHLSEREQRALFAAGSAPFVSTCSDSELVWSKKRFIEAYLRRGELERSEALLSTPIPQMNAAVAGLAKKKAL